ncbi:MAG: riboflavin kinase [Candidatus Liptonbacteria bacterium]|nr:riboflavin kinase [Candidatus Liptonbacteria bacterium]
MRTSFKTAGVVIKGTRQGVKLGFPTANIVLLTDAPSGIYAGKTTLNGNVYPSAIYIGPDRKLLETHLIDFSQEIYNQKISVQVDKKIREVIRFDNYDDLIAAIHEDIAQVKKFYRL